LAGAVRTGKIGTREGARMVEEAASQGAQALTYAPRGEAGQEYAADAGAALQNLVPLTGLARPVGMIQEQAGMAGQTARIAGAARMDRMRQPAATPAAATPAGVPAAPAAAPVTAEALAATARRAAEPGLGRTNAQRVLAEEAAPDQRMLADAKRLGIDQNLQPGHLTTSEAFRQIDAAIKSNPQSQVALAERAGLAEIAKSSAQLIDDLGGTRDLSTLSQSINNRITARRDVLDAQEGKLWNKSTQLINPRRQVDAPETKGTVQSMVRELGGDAQADLAIPDAARRFLKPMMADEPMTYAYLDLARKQVGQAIGKKSGPFADMERGMLDRFYAALSKDQEAIAQAAGSDAFYAFQAAKYATRLKKGLEDDLTALFGRDLDKSLSGGREVGIAGATVALAKGDAARMNKLMGMVPKDMREQVAVSAVGKMLGDGLEQGQMDFRGYRVWYEGLMRNKESQKAIMSHLPLSTRKQLHALYRVSRGVSQSINRRTETGKLGTIKDEMMGVADGTMESLYNLAKRSAVAIPAEAVSSSVGLPGAGMSAGIASALTKGKPKTMALVDELIASPEFDRMVRTPPGPAKVSAARKLAKSAAFDKLLKAVGSPPEIMADREAWILQASQLGSVPVQQQNRDRRTLN
jgi:hypothetical protein